MIFQKKSKIKRIHSEISKKSGMFTCVPLWGFDKQNYGWVWGGKLREINPSAISKS